MMPFKQCPVCGSGNLIKKQVQKHLHGNGNSVTMRVEAEVCLHCGERLYTEDVVKSFEKIRKKLKNKEFSQLKSLGRSFTVVKNFPNKAIQPSK